MRLEFLARQFLTDRRRRGMQTARAVEFQS